MCAQEANSLSRRGFLASGLTIAAGVGLLNNINITTDGGWSTASANDNDPTKNNPHVFLNKLADVASGPDAAMLRPLIAALATNPAIPSVAAGILQNYFSSLTSFQVSLLKAIPIMTRDPGTLTSLVSGVPLLPPQHASAHSIKEALEHNPAMRTITRTAHKLRLRRNTSVLQTNINAVISNSTRQLHTPTTLRNAALDSLLTSIFNLKESTPFSTLTTAIIPLMQDQRFIPFLREHEKLIATFIPGPTLVAPLLPNDRAPLIPADVQSTLNIMGLVVTYAAALIGAAFVPSLLIAGVLLALATVGFAAFAAPEFLHLYELKDCDFDGDPGDPNDVPPGGSECPA